MYQISLSLQSSICLCRENEISEPHCFIKQECIPVECVPAAHWPYAGICFPGGGLQSWGVPGPGGVGVGCLVRGGVCLVQGGVCLVQGVAAWSGGCMPGLGGVCLVQGGLPGLGGVSLVWGVSAWSWGGLAGPGGSPYWRPPLWTEWQTGVKILPWPQLRCGR